MTITMNDGTDAAPYLRKDINISTIIDLPDHSSGPHLTYFQQEELCSLLKAHGYQGVQTALPDAALSMGLAVTGMGDVHAPADADKLAARQKDQGYQATTLHVGTGLESDDDMDRLAGAVLEAEAKHGHPLYIETHRATMTQDIRRTLDLIERFPQLGFNADLSHWYTGHEMNANNFAPRVNIMQPLFDRVRFMHGRIGDTGSIQVAFEAGDDYEFLTHHRILWTKCFEGFLRSAKPGDFLPFNPEILPARFDIGSLQLNVNYARHFTGADGIRREEGDRWAQAQLYWQIAEDCFAAAQRNLSAA